MAVTLVTGSNAACMTYSPANVPKMVIITIRRNLTARHGLMTTGMIMGAILSAAATRPTLPTLFVRTTGNHAKQDAAWVCAHELHKDLQLLASVAGSQAQDRGPARGEPRAMAKAR